MRTRKKTKQAPAEPDGDLCATCGRGRSGDGAPALLERILTRVEERLADGDVKPTVGDYVRLLQYREELKTDEQPKEIRVTWVEPESESETGE